MLYESADPLARLYTPLLKVMLSRRLSTRLCPAIDIFCAQVDDTFVLQEYFVPREAFSSFAQGLKKVRVASLSPLFLVLVCTTVLLIAACFQTVLEGVNKETQITLLNITIRFVLQVGVLVSISCCAHSSFP
jgi:hypothetical protein